MEAISLKQFSFITPPRAYGGSGPAGQVIVFPFSSAGQYLDLTNLNFGQVYAAGQAFQSQVSNGVVGTYVTVEAEGTDLGIATANTAAAVAGLSGKPILANLGSLNASGAYSGVTGTCYRIPAGTAQSFLLQPSQDLYMGFCGGSGVTGTCRIYQSSPANP